MPGPRGRPAIAAEAAGRDVKGASAADHRAISFATARVTDVDVIAVAHSDLPSTSPPGWTSKWVCSRSRPDAWAAFGDPAVVHGMCEDYRAGLRADRRDEEADRAAGRKIQCPVLLLASTDDDLDIHGDPEAIWRPWTAGELRSRPIHSGHHQAEQAPDELATALLDFLGHPAPHQAVVSFVWCGNSRTKPVRLAGLCCCPR
jgi:pimeloyl-ACP methyl ester carboxylesterase